MKIQISCPKCNWKPDGNDYWVCECGNIWNTFETSGKCPKCQKVWTETQCPQFEDAGGCGSWSKHLDWYKNLDDIIKKELIKTIEETLEKSN
jgi:hypothetical protein